MPDQFSSFKSGYIAIVGLANVGKSTFLNTILRCKISAVSSKPQTTYENILGILNEDGFQMVFVDTPGWLNPNDSFQAGMKKSILRSINEDADLIAWLIDAQTFSKSDLEFASVLKKVQKPLFAAVNKIDLVDEKQILEKVSSSLEGILGPELKLYPVSANNSRGIGTLKKDLISALPVSPPYFPTDQLTDRWERFYVAQIIREKIFESFGQEVPHASFVSIDEFNERPDRKDFIKAIIYVESEGQKGIIIGKGGGAIKKLGEESRKEIETQLGRPVFLDISVKVHRNWRNDNVFLRTHSMKARTIV